VRDIALAIVLAVLSPLGVLHPWIGVLLWSWVSLMSPHRMTYGFMYDAPVAMLTAIVTLIGLLVSRDPKKLPLAAPLVWLALFCVWMCVTFFFSIVDTSENLSQLDKVLKIYLFTFISAAVIWTRRQVDILVAVATFSIAFFGVKGGIFTLLTGGAFRVRGDGGFIAGNNEIGLALIMIVPMMYYFVIVLRNVWLKRMLWLAMLLCVVAALGTQSRGALLGVIAMTLAFIVRSPNPGRLIAPILLLSLFVLLFLPESWWERMGTIDDYQTDESAMGRINAWILAWNVATTHPFGGGFTLEVPQLFERFAPNPDFIAVAHSIYFQILGQHGFVGLLLFLGFWISTWRTCRWVARNSPSPQDQALARMIEISLVGYAVGGAFLNMAYFDGPYYLMAALVVVRYKLLAGQRPAAVSAAASNPAQRA
jgi:putative inorganic carbon (hco3(-)) transporter